MDADTLRQYLEFYQDLGIKTLYRRSARRQQPLRRTAGSPPSPPKPEPPLMELPPLARPATRC